MSLFRRDTPPPTDSWETLREWANYSWWQRYRASLMVMLPLMTFIIGVAGIALLIAEPSWRTAKFIAGMWAVALPLTALGYMRRMARAAAQVPPISPASRNPTTAVDIRGNRERTPD
ncbi:MAG: hypothetical protein ABIZ64_04595 [Casimicrobium sp.]